MTPSPSTSDGTQAVTLGDREPAAAEARATASLRERQRVLRYLVVGALGFLVDGGVLTVEVHGFGLDPILARGPSFLAAVTVTWLANRTHTFAGLRRHSAAAEYRRYVTTQTLGAMVNLAVYALALGVSAWCARVPVAGLALGSAVGLTVNYALARRYVFAAA